MYVSYVEKIGGCRLIPNRAKMRISQTKIKLRKEKEKNFFLILVAEDDQMKVTPE